MKSGYIFLVAQVIKAESRRAVKEEIFRREMQDPDFKELVRLVYSPTINFYVTDEYIRKLGRPEFGEREFGTEIFKLIEDLSTRKISGKAVDGVLMEFMSGLNGHSYELLLNIFKRTLDLGLNFAMIEKVAPGLIKKQPYMRCITEKEADLHNLDWANGIIGQVKLDGMYIACRIDCDNNRQFTTRAGLRFPEGILDSLLPEILHPGLMRNVDLNGEITLLDKSGRIVPRQISNGIFNSASYGTPIPPEYQLQYTIWDVVPSLDVDRGECTRPYIDRLYDAQIWVAACPNLRLIESGILMTLESAFALRDEMLAVGEEGIILKDPYSIWKNGVNRKMIKLKGAYIATLRVVGFTEGKRGKFFGMVGALQCISEDGLLSVNVSGFSDAVRRDMTLNRDGWFHKLVDVQHGGVIEDSETGICSLIEPRLAMDSIRTDIIVGDTLEKIAKGG